MRCDICPLKANSIESLDQVFSKISRCDECEIEATDGSSRLVSLLRQAGKNSRKLRADNNRFKQELRDFQDGTNTDRSRIDKLEFLHATAMRELESALAERDNVVRQQVDAIRALSSPILEVGPGVLAVPIIGTLSEERAHDMMHDLLMAVINRSAERVALDLTGLSSMDGATAERIASLCKAVALIGACVVLSGLRPEVASALVAENIDFSSVKTVRSLQDAITTRRPKSKT